MKKINKKIDMFCYKHPGFGIPNLMLYIVGLSLAVWIIGLMDNSNVIVNYLTFSPALILKGQVWRLITFVFIPQSYSIWALLFFYFYYWIGNVLERNWGTTRFNIFLLSGILLTAVYGFIIYFITKQNISVGTYYIYMSMFFSFATLFPDMQVLFMFIIPVKIKWLAYIDAAMFLFAMITTPFPFNLLPLVAMLNYFLFFGDDLIAMTRPVRAKTSKTTVTFNREKSRIKYEQRNASYTYKCAVCGKTDTDYPELEFRYCSRCAGYHCFCSEHIGNHVHLKK